MALRLKPHALTLIQASETVIGKTVQSTDHEQTTIVVRGMLTPISASRAFEVYGVEAEVTHQFMFEPQDLPHVKVGNRFRDELGRLLAVAAPAQLWNAEPRTEHGHAPLNDLSARRDA